jgi:RNA polymerase sigma-70 factor (ECF subfamily)
MVEPDDDDLVRRAQAGDVRAFEKLIQEHIPRLRRFARSFTDSDFDADDLAQDALVKIFRSLRSYRSESSFSTWMYQVTKNAFMDARRHRATVERAVAMAAEAVAVAPGPLAPEVLLLEAERREQLWRALRALPPEFRTVLVLCDVEGLSISEVAAIERIAEGTVKSRLHRGRARLVRLVQAADLAGNQVVARFVTPTEGMETP